MSMALKKKIENAEFVLLLCVWEKISKYLYVVSKTLQSFNINLQDAYQQLENTHSEIKNYVKSIIYL